MGKRKGISSAVAGIILVIVIILVTSGCTKHCKIEACQNEAVSGSSYCEVHTCKVDNCYERTVTESPYCEEHICNVYGCKSPHLEESDFCSMHTCAVSGCYAEVVEGKRYCSKHKCKESSCNKASIEGFLHCEKHLVKDDFAKPYEWYKFQTEKGIEDAKTTTAAQYVRIQLFDDTKTPPTYMVYNGSDPLLTCQFMDNGMVIGTEMELYNKNPECFSSVIVRIIENVDDTCDLDEVFKIMDTSGNVTYTSKKIQYMFDYQVKDSSVYIYYFLYEL